MRIHLINVLEYDPINSFHIHGNFFHYYPTGTMLTPSEYTDTISQVQGQRGIAGAPVPVSGQVHVPRPQDRVRRTGLDGLLRGERIMTLDDKTGTGTVPPKCTAGRRYRAGCSVSGRWS